MNWLTRCGWRLVLTKTLIVNLLKIVLYYINLISIEQVWQHVRVTSYQFIY